MSSAHVVRVQRLYRASLKNMLYWAIHRRLWIKKANDIRAEFEANRHLDNARQIEKILTAGEARLAEYKHPDPYKRAGAAPARPFPARPCPSILFQPTARRSRFSARSADGLWREQVHALCQQRRRLRQGCARRRS